MWSELFRKLRPVGGQRGVPILRDQHRADEVWSDTLWRKDASVSMARTFAASRKWAEPGWSPGGSCSMELVMDVVGCSVWRLEAAVPSKLVKVCQSLSISSPLSIHDIWYNYIYINYSIHIHMIMNKKRYITMNIIIYIYIIFVTRAESEQCFPWNQSIDVVFSDDCHHSTVRPVFGRCRGTAARLQGNPLPRFSAPQVLSLNLSKPWGAFHYSHHSHLLLMRWWSPRHREAIQVLLGAWRLSGAAVWCGDRPYTWQPVACLNDMETRLSSNQFVALQILISNIKVRCSAHRSWKSTKKNGRTEPYRRPDRLGLRQPGGLRVVLLTEYFFPDLSTSEIDWAKQCTFLAWCVTCSDL